MTQHVNPCQDFDPNAAASPDAGIFGLTFARDDAGIVLLPVRFDATTSYGGGASAGPEAIFDASMQVDLLDHHFGLVYEAGLHMSEAPEWVAEISKRARGQAEGIIAKGGADESDAALIKEIDAAGDKINAWTYEQTAAVLKDGKVPGLIGGDHSTPYGAIRACAEHVAALAKKGDKDAALGLGILHIDAHWDLRESFEGFKWSHASIMRNVMEEISGVTRLVSVGIRDYCPEEKDFADSSSGRVRTYFDADVHAKLDDGVKWSDLCAKIVADLPPCVYVSFDIDGLDPSLCPGTGTPVPGGLSFSRAASLLAAVKSAGKRVIGFDLVEVCPVSDESEWDANVGARVLYKMCGMAVPPKAR
ncbi:MAG: agmatinase family protein [Phycisphaerales bacterium]